MSRRPERSPKQPPKHQRVARAAAKVLEPLRVSPVADPGQAELSRTQAAVLPALEAMIESVPRRRARSRRRQWGRRVGQAAAVLAAAAAWVLWFGQDFGSGRPETAGRGPQLAVIGGQLANDGRQLALGSVHSVGSLGRLSTAQGHGARLTVAGVQLTLSPESTADLTFAAGMQRVALSQGGASLDVPPLAPGTTLSVTTPDAVVTVHGTRFGVALQRGTTCVRVQQGVVSVLRGATRERLTAGQHSGCHARPEQAASPEREAASRLPATRQVAPLPSARRGVTSRGRASEPGRSHGRASEPGTTANQPQPDAVSPGTLMLENAMFQRALVAEQRGDLPAAADHLKRLLHDHPRSPLRGEALRVQQRVRAREPVAPGASASHRTAGALTPAPRGGPK